MILRQQPENQGTKGYEKEYLLSFRYDIELSQIFGVLKIGGVLCVLL